MSAFVNRVHHFTEINISKTSWKFKAYFDENRFYLLPHLIFLFCIFCKHKKVPGRIGGSVLFQNLHTAMFSYFSCNVYVIFIARTAVVRQFNHLPKICFWLAGETWKIIPISPSSHFKWSNRKYESIWNTFLYLTKN